MTIRTLLIPLALFAFASIAGCTASLTAYPKTAANVQMELNDLGKYFSPDIIKGYDDLTDKEKQRKRDEIVAGRVRAIDIQFNEFQNDLFREGVGSGIATDWAVLALSGAGATIASASTALSAASAVIVGAKSSFDKNAFFDKTMPTLLATMVAKRKDVLVGIREGLTKDINEYPLQLALNDVDTYYYVGSIPGSLQEIGEESGKTAKQADERLQTLLTKGRTKSFLAQDARTRVNDIVAKIAELKDSEALALSKGPPTHDFFSETAVQQQDPNNRRFTDPGAARMTLGTRAREDSRTEESLRAWEKALGL